MEQSGSNLDKAIEANTKVQAEPLRTYSTVIRDPAKGDKLKVSADPGSSNLNCCQQALGSLTRSGWLVGNTDISTANFRVAGENEAAGAAVAAVVAAE